MRIITVKASEIRLAIARANATSAEYQTELIEIALIPSVNRRWHELNKNLEPLILLRHPGLPDPAYNMSREDYIAITDWSKFAGYTLTYHGNSNWNSVRESYFCHSPNTTWDGIRRQTKGSMAIQCLRIAYYAALHNRSITHEGLQYLEYSNIVFSL